MIKTDLELLEKNRDDAQSMVLALQAQVNLAKSKIIGLGDNPERSGREKALGMFEKELEGHRKMVRELDAMIEEEKKENETVHKPDK